MLYLFFIIDLLSCGCKILFQLFAQFHNEFSECNYLRAGEAGFATKRVLEHDPNARVKVVAYINDNPRKTEKEVDGIRIYPFNELDNLFRLYEVNEIIISSFSIPARRRAQLVEVCLEKNITVLNVPPLDKWINGQFSKKQLQSIKIEQLLEREPIQLNYLELGKQLKDHRVVDPRFDTVA
jgi:FlaA1/EpsC-like NDP-sugar epimerase